MKTTTSSEPWPRPARAGARSAEKATAAIPTGRLTIRFAMAATVVGLTVAFSGQALIALGQNYMLGSTPEKIHPATYFGFLFVTIQFFSRGHDRLAEVFKTYPGTTWLAVCTTVLAIYAGLLLAVPGSGLPDTWILPILIFVLCSQLKRIETATLRVGIDVFLAINSLVGIAEILTNKRVIPLSVASSLLGQYVYPIEWRASAFLGHPLTNAYATGCYILLLILDRRVRPIGLRLALLGLHGAGMVVFGSRGAMVFLGVVLAFAGLWQMMSAALVGRVQRDALIYAGSAVVMAFLGLPALLASGFADRFIDRFFVDHGSAQARSGALEMIASLSWSDIVMGPPKTLIDALGLRFGVGAGIESFWLGFLVTFGIVGCVIFMPALFLFCRDLVRRTNPMSAVVLVYFFACCSTSVSLSSRTSSLAILVSLLMTSRHMRSPAPVPEAISESAQGYQFVARPAPAGRSAQPVASRYDA